MTDVEIFIVVCVCLIPIIALVVLLPKIKFKKQEKVKKIKSADPAPTEKYVPTAPIVESAKIEEKTIKPMQVKYTSNDFKDYLLDKQSRIGHPKFNELPENYLDRTRRYDPNYDFMPKTQEAKSVAEEIQTLSPELRAMILAGVLDKRDFD